MAPGKRVYRICYSLGCFGDLVRVTGLSETAPLPSCAKASQAKRDHSPPPANSRPIDTSTTAPRVAAARLYMNPPRSMPSCEKIHPPSTAPTNPSKTFAMHPKPRPRETFPASQPAMRPTSSHPIKVRGTVKKKRCMECSFSAKLQLAPARALRGFLLRHTVYRAQAQYKIETCDSDHFAPRKQRGKFGEGHGVVWIVERGNQHNLVRNIKIGIARGKPLPIEIHGRGHGQCCNAQHVAVLIVHLGKQSKILLQRRVIRFGRIFFNYGHHRCRIHKARQIVHVAVRVVPRDPVLEPQDVSDAEKIPEDF